MAGRSSGLIMRSGYEARLILFLYKEGDQTAPPLSPNLMHGIICGQNRFESGISTHAYNF